MNRLLIAGVVAFVLLVTALSSLFIVTQTEQVVVTQFGEPIRIIREPGLAWKIPFVQNVISLDRRLLDFEGPREEVILGDQRRLVVDSFARFRITPPMLQSAAARVHAITQDPVAMQAVRMKAGIVQHPNAAAPTPMPGE
jgi:membrane protease subunit HflC